MVKWQIFRRCMHATIELAQMWPCAKWNYSKRKQGIYHLLLEMCFSVLWIWYHF